jgi:hypothetical protein
MGPGNELRGRVRDEGRLVYHKHALILRPSQYTLQEVLLQRPTGRTVSNECLTIVAKQNKKKRPLWET